MSHVLIHDTNDTYFFLKICKSTNIYLEQDGSEQPRPVSHPVLKIGTGISHPKKPQAGWDM